MDISAVCDDETGEISLFLVNRHEQDVLDFELSLDSFGALEIIDHQVMVHDDLRAVNTEQTPFNVMPSQGSGAALNAGCLNIALPPLSFQMVRLAKANGWFANLN